MTGIYFNELFLEHDTGFGHPERPDRLRAVIKTLSETGLAGQACRMITNSPADVEAFIPPDGPAGEDRALDA